MLHKPVITLVFLAFVLLVPTQLLAQGRPTNLPTPRGQQATRSAVSQERACEARSAAIKTRSENLLRMGGNMLDKFGQISDRTQQFYTNKILVSGKEVLNYNNLISEIASKSAEVETKLNKAQQEADDFSCSNPNPRADVRAFNQAMRDVIRALKEYRTSIRNLIVAVHSVVGEENRSATSSSNLNSGGQR